MGVVRRLPDDLANQIAAGEVVERPASVAKELVENAIDAGATRVRIDVEGGGVELLRVSDDGSGMSEEDARLALERHATSKLRTLADLARIATYGFRGEALPSIASVSRFVLRTRRREDESAVELFIEGGAEPRVLPAGGAAGTTVEVRDLFFNVPARRKFLRAAGTESSHVSGVAEEAALSQPSLTVQLAREGRVVREWLRAGSREERVRAALKEESLATCAGERGPLRVEAFLSRPERARAGAGQLRLLVNGRVVNDRGLARAVAQAYGSVLEPGRYPVGVVYLDLPLDLVDVNVHPQKAEVRFADPRAVQDALFRVLADQLARAFAMPVATRWQRPAGLGARTPPPAPEEVQTTFTPATAAGPAHPLPKLRAEPEEDPWQLALGPVIAGAAAARAPAAPAFVSAAEPAGGPAAGSGEMRAQFRRLSFLAQVRQTYLVCEGPDGLYVLDQHAAAERVTFHRMRRAYAGRDVPTQTLLFPVSVEVTASEAAFVEEAHEELSRFGLDVRAIGPTTVGVHAVPRVLARATPEILVRDLLAEAGRTGGRAFSNAVDLVLATMACHGSVRAGDRLAREEAAALLLALDEVDFAGHCPHGRPIVTRLGWDELERKVGRR